MSMKGGAKPGGRKLIVDRKEFSNPSGDAGGKFSLCRAITAAMDGLPPDMINMIIRQCEGLPGSSSEVDIRNFLKTVTTEMRDQKKGLITLLGAYPADENNLQLEIALEEFTVKLLTAIDAAEKHENAILNNIPITTMSSYKEILDHLVPALYYLKNADDLYCGIDKTRPSLLPDFMRDIDPDSIDQIQFELNLQKAREIDVTQIINVALNSDDDEEQVFGNVASVMPIFISPFSGSQEKKKVLKDFEQILEAFKDGALGGFDAARDFIAEIDEPGLKAVFEISLKYAVQKRLEDHQTNTITLTDDEVMRLQEYTLKAKPVIDQWVASLQKQLDKSLPQAMQLLHYIEDGPSLEQRDPAIVAAKDLARSYAEARIALQEYQDLKSPAAYEQLMQVLDDIAANQDPAAMQIVLEYDAQAAKLEAEHRLAVERQREEIEFQIAMAAPKAPEASGPGMMSGSGDGGGGFG